jgi:hypothetical protein
MTRTKTKSVDFQSLRIRGQSATTVVKLMMACNDLTVTNQALDDWKKEERRLRKSRQADACRYFIRAQIAHLHEGLKIIEEIQEDSTLRTLVGQCDRRTQKSFQELQQYAPGGAKRPWFEQLAGKIRHNLTFHYQQSGKLIEKAIARGAAGGRVSSITRGSTAHLWHLKVADDIVASIVLRQIWNIPPDADVRTEADRISDEVCYIFLLFLDFSGEFVWKYCGR